jgi:hypothetical protein
MSEQYNETGRRLRESFEEATDAIREFNSLLRAMFPGRGVRYTLHKAWRQGKREAKRYPSL